MNLLLLPTLALGALCFWLGGRWYRRASPPRRLAWAVSLTAAVPGAFFVLYYTHLFGEPVWLYDLRVLSGSELLAAGLGLPAGMLQAGRHDHRLLERHTSKLGIPLLLTFALLAPHLKPVLSPLRLPPGPALGLPPDGVCRQTMPSTCGPASAVTLAKLAGVTLDEQELAKESLASARGTEAWYLARALRRHGLSTDFVNLPLDTEALPSPVIAGVVLKSGVGHFIPILGQEDGRYVIGDPIVGRETRTLAQLRAEYRFTGFFMLIR